MKSEFKTTVSTLYTGSNITPIIIFCFFPIIVWSSANGQKYDTLWMTSKLNLKSTTETTSSMSVIRIQLANNSQHFLEITSKNPVAWKSREVMDSATSQVRIDNYFRELISEW